MDNKIVYLHRKNTDRQVFYVGMGDKKRAYSKQRSEIWNRVAKKYGFYIDIVAENLNIEDAFELECFLIEIYGRLDLKTGNLVNMTEGGCGAIGLNCSLEKKRKYNMSKIERNSEWKRKISEAHKGKIFSNETLKKMSDAKIGKKITEETRLKMKNSNKSKDLSGIKVNMFCFYTNDFLNSFDSISEAAKFISRTNSCISNNINSNTKYVTVKNNNNKKVIFKKK